MKSTLPKSSEPKKVIHLKTINPKLRQAVIKNINFAKSPIETPQSNRVLKLQRIKAAPQEEGKRAKNSNVRVE